MKMNILLCILTFCTFVVGCTNKPKQKEAPQAPINNAVGINDTLGLSLHPEFPVYSTKQKQVTFVLHNNSGTDIGFGGYYSYTYEDEKGIWRDVPMQLVVFDEEIILWQGNKYYYNAELFRHTPGRYRFFLTVRRYSKEYTLMAEFQLQNNVVELFKRHPYSQLNDTLLRPEEEAVYPPIYNVIDQMPEFPGGMDKLLQFINDNMKYPTKAQTEGIQGRVAVQFIVDENGYIIEPNIVKNVEPSLDKEALRIIKTLPQWKPGTLKGKAVKVKYTVPVTFRLDKIKEEIPKTSQSATQILRPVPSNIPTGKKVNPDSLSMETEYAYYPLSTTKVKISVTNHSRQKYTCGNEYSLTFYNSSKRQWETLPTNPDIKDIGWVLYPQYSPYQSTGKLFTFEVPNSPGKYRIYKTFYRDTKKKVAYAEFEILPEDGAERMLKIVDEYLDKYRNKEDAVSQNFSTWGLRGDTLDMTWSVNSPYMRRLFKERVLSYSATVVNNGKETTTRTLDRISYTDTLDVTMKTEKPIYPVGTKLVKVTLTNNNENELSIGTDYYIVRKEKDRWVFLHGDQIWNLVEIRMQQNDSYTFHAALYPLLNNNLPGTYRVIKHVDFINSPSWTMAAEFRIE